MPSKFTVETKNFKRVAHKIDTRLARYERTRKHIFADPLKRTITNVKRQLQLDRKTGFNHIYTGRMFANTRYETAFTSLEQTDVYFGFFVPYGLTFELGGKPRSVPLAKLKPWAQVRFGTEIPAYSIQKSIKSKGTRAYNIILPVWERNQDNYLKIVNRRFWKVWT